MESIETIGDIVSKALDEIRKERQEERRRRIARVKRVMDRYGDELNDADLYGIEAALHCALGQSKVDGLL